MKTNSFFRFFVTIIMVIMIISVTSCGPHDEPTAPDTTKPTVTLSSSNLTYNSVTLTFSASDNVKVATCELDSNGTYLSSNPTSPLVVSNLKPNRSYTFLYKAIDDAGNIGQTSITVTTPTNIVASSWFSQPVVSIRSTFAIEQNAQSDTISIKLNNTSNSNKIGNFSLNFGVNGTAIKMLRYQPSNATDSTGWTVLTPTSDGTVTFSNVLLRSGVTILKAIFAIKENAGVTNGSALTLSVSSLNDGTGANAPIEGSFAQAINAGTVNSTTQATKLMTDWLGTMSKPGYELDASANGRAAIYYIQNLKMSGPGNARWGSVKLKNPYANFNKIVWDNSSWVVNPNGVPDQSVSSVSWNKNFVKLTFTNSNIIKVDGTTYNLDYISVSSKNTGTSTFSSVSFTPGLYGFALVVKFDLVIYNSDNQVIDLSDVNVRQDGSIVAN